MQSIKRSGYWAKTIANGFASVNGDGIIFNMWMRVILSQISELSWESWKQLQQNGEKRHKRENGKC